MSSMAKIIAIYNEKGGSGKTTTTCQLAGALGMRGYEVLVADLDPQQTAAKWVGRSADASFPAVIWPGYLYKERVAVELEKLAAKYEIIVVDCAPSVEQPSTWPVLLVCDIALIPTKLNPPDLDALPAAKNLAKLAHDKSGRAFPVRVVPNACRMHMIDDMIAVESLQADSTYPPLSVTLGDRKAYTRSMLYGATAHALKGAEASVREIEAMTDQVLKLVGLAKQKKGERK